MNYLFIKRIFDIFASLIGLIALFPLLLLAAVCIKLIMKGPIFFSQQRPGLKGKVFKMYKFRTMIQKENLPDNQRITWLGKFLRKTSIDELPELYNVFKGEMSLVGPRPLLTEYLSFYSAEQMKRHDVKPGITGWAQINGRNSLTWEKKFELDLWYVQNANLWLDLKIIFFTFRAVFKREGINHNNEITMMKFNGSQKDVA
jgi:sugar transferase EpsL